MACLIAWATNMGLGRMGAISDLSYQTLAATSESFLRLETLGEANDRISNALATLPIFRQYDSATRCIPVAMARSLRRASRRSMPAIPRNTSGSQRGRFP